MLRLRNRTYHVQYEDKGKTRSMSLHTSDRREAEKLHRVFMMSLRAVRRARRFAQVFPELTNAAPPDNRAPVPAAHQRGGVLLSELFEYANSRRPLSRDHAQAWRHFVNHVGVRFADQVTPQIAQAYLDESFGGMKAKTYNNHKTMLNTIFRISIVHAGLAASPFASICNKMLTDVNSHRNLTETEIALLMKHGDLQIRTMVMLARWTGQRLETCARIRWTDIDEEKRVFLIQPGKTARFGKFVAVPIFEPLYQYLKEIRPESVHPSTPIIASVSEWVSADKFSHRFGYLMRELGISDGKACFHSLRGNFITWAKESGLSADIRRSITGHSSLSTEDIYSEALRNVSAAAKTAAI